ncbi:hypothetical protein ACFLYX_04145, partial [Chloroflexota bacterium]
IALVLSGGTCAYTFSTASGTISINEPLGGVPTFWMGNTGNTNRTLSVTGGTYTLTSRESTEWKTGRTVTPEFYCEVTQR